MARRRRKKCLRGSNVTTVVPLLTSQARDVIKSRGGKALKRLLKQNLAVTSCQTGDGFWRLVSVTSTRKKPTAKRTGRTRRSGRLKARFSDVLVPPMSSELPPVPSEPPPFDY